MKHVLSIEQMQHLRSLGVDTTKASTVLLFFDENGDNVGWEVENNGNPGAEPLYESWNDDTETWDSTHKEYFDAETGGYDHSYREDCGVFDLQDILEILPKEIDGYDLVLFADNHIQYEIWDKKSSAKILYQVDGSSLIDCAYRMLCWCAENGKLRKEK